MSVDASAAIEGAARHRLHPATILAKTLGVLPQAAAGLIGIAVVMLREAPGRLVLFALAGAGLALVFAGLHWWRFRYGLGEREIVITHGVLKRHRRVIPFDRVQDISIERGPLARLFGTARVRIETGGSGSAEGDLDMIALADARAMRDVLRRWNAAPASEGAAGEESGRAPEPLLFRMGVPRLLAAGLFNFSLVFLAILFGALQYVELATGIDLFDPQGVWGPAAQAAGRITLLASALILLVVLALGIVTGVARTVATDYGFRLTRSETGLRRRRGLFTLSEMVIPIRRMQAAIIDSGLIGRLVGWHALSFQTLGMGRGIGGLQVAAPFARMDEIAPILAAPGFPAVPPRASHRRMPVRAAARRAALPLAGALLAAITSLWVPEAGFAAGFLALLAVAGIVRWRRHHYALDGAALFVSAGFLKRRRWIIPYARIQNLRLDRGPAQRALRLATLRIDTAGAPMFGAAIVDLDAGDAGRIAALLLHRHRAARQALRR